MFGMIDAELPDMVKFKLVCNSCGRPDYYVNYITPSEDMEYMREHVSKVMRCESCLSGFHIDSEEVLGLLDDAV